MTRASGAGAKIEALAEKRFKLVEGLVEKPSGLAWCAQHTRIADEIASLLFVDLFGALSDRVALIATGGYGRSELCPYSDIDITVLPDDGSLAELEGPIRLLFKELHWAFGVARLDVGYAYRLIADAPGLDAKTRTGLLDMRLIAGSDSLFRDLEGALQGSFAAGEFVLQKIEERREMYGRFNDTPLVVEPDLKEGAGGLRDFHCANWIAEAIGEAPSRPSSAYDTLMRYRNLLHVFAGRSRDQLTRVRQGEISEALGLGVDALVAEVTGAGSVLHQVFVRACEKLGEGRFMLSPGTLAVNGEVRVLPVSSAGDAAVGVALGTKLGLSVTDLPTRAGDGSAGASAAYALSTGEATIRNLDRCSLLDQLLPELTRCRTLASRDSIHTYTVFEHTLRVVRLLDSVDSEFVSLLKGSVTDLEPLYLAALLHDVGKFDTTREHSVAGAEMARDVCARWRLGESLSELVVWLVREHLTMERFIRIRDVSHPGTAEEFAGIVGDTERLKLLTLLTWADVNAVAEGTWTKAQDAFLKQLYEATFSILEGAVVEQADEARSRQRLLRQIRKDPSDEGRVQAFLESLPVYYLASTSAETVRLQMQFAERAVAGEPTVDEYPVPELGATEFTICTLDSPGLLSRMLGVLYAFDLSVIGIRACTTSTEPNVAIDVFTVSFAGRVVPKATAAQVGQALRDVLSGARPADSVLVARGKDPSRKQEFFTYNFIQGSSGNPAILEIRAPRGRGMAYRFSRLFAAEGWNILAARVGQWAGNGAAAFYLTDSGGGALSESQVKAVLVS